MKLYRIAAAGAVLATAVTLSACSNDQGSEDTSTSSAESSSSSAAAMPELPSAADLNAVIAKASDPQAPIEEKVKTVQGGETAAELFDILAQRKAELGSDFQVQDPVLPGYTNDSVLTNLVYTEGDRRDEIQDISFVFEDGQWKLSRADACVLITSALPPEQVPAMCHDDLPPAEGEQPAPAEGEQPAPAPAPAEGEQPAPAPAPEEAPAPAQ